MGDIGTGLPKAPGALSTVDLPLPPAFTCGDPLPFTSPSTSGRPQQSIYHPPARRPRRLAIGAEPALRQGAANARGVTERQAECEPRGNPRPVLDSTICFALKFSIAFILFGRRRRTTLLSDGKERVCEIIAKHLLYVYGALWTVPLTLYSPPRTPLAGTPPSPPKSPSTPSPLPARTRRCTRARRAGGALI